MGLVDIEKYFMPAFARTWGRTQDIPGTSEFIAETILIPYLFSNPFAKYMERISSSAVYSSVTFR